MILKIKSKIEKTSSFQVNIYIDNFSTVKGLLKILKTKTAALRRLEIGIGICRGKTRVPLPPHGPPYEFSNICPTYMKFFLGNLERIC